MEERHQLFTRYISAHNNVVRDLWQVRIEAAESTKQLNKLNEKRFLLTKEYETLQELTEKLIKLKSKEQRILKCLRETKSQQRAQLMAEEIEKFKSQSIMENSQCIVPPLKK